MPRYIDRAKLLELIDKALFESPEDGEEQIGILKCRKIIRECPAETIEMPEVYFEMRPEAAQEDVGGVEQNADAGVFGLPDIRRNADEPARRRIHLPGIQTKGEGQ